MDIFIGLSYIVSGDLRCSKYYFSVSFPFFCSFFFIFFLCGLFFFFTGVNGGGLYFTIEPQDVVVEQGGSARLDCEAKSIFGQPTIQWRTDDGTPINFIGENYR